MSNEGKIMQQPKIGLYLYSTVFLFRTTVLTGKLYFKLVTYFYTKTVSFYVREIRVTLNEISLNELSYRI